MDPYANDKFCGDITCRNDEELMKFTTVSLQCGCSVAIKPLKGGRFHLTIFREEDSI